VPFAAGIPDPAVGVLLGDTFGSMRERGTSAGDASGPKTRYHLLTTDGGNAEADALASTPLGPLRPKPKPSIDELPLE
jgi:hypothetical protein